MTISATPFPSEMIRDGKIPVGQLAYFRERLKNRLHEIVFLEFLRQEDTYGLTKTELGNRIGKPPERITRLLGAPGNWTLDTVSDLLLGMGTELDFDVALLVDKIADIQQEKVGVAAETGGVRAGRSGASASLNALATAPPNVSSQVSLASGIASQTGAIPQR